MERKLLKSRSNVKIDGVCAGVARYLGADVTIIRIITVLWAFSGGGLIAYIICALIIPREPKGFVCASKNEPPSDIIDDDVMDYRDYPNKN